MEELKFNESGLIPAIIQDAKTNQVLMMAYMNKESLEISIKEQRTCFWSRSRQELWRKGETSGNVQEIVSISSDCDKDTLLIKVNPKGPACHTGAISCFYNKLAGTLEDTFSMQELYELIKGRKTNPQEGSYTTYLFQKGDDKILKKIGEESTEVVIAAKNQDNQEIIFEVSDLIYHLMVLLAEKGIGLDEIYKELGNRHVVDKKVKQETMQ